MNPVSYSSVGRPSGASPPLFRGYLVSTTQYLFLKSATSNLSRPDYKLFCHLFVSTVAHYRQLEENGKGWIPITARFIQSTFYNADPERLHDLIDIDRRYTKGKRPRRYRLKPWILDGYVNASLADDATDRRLVNIVTGKPPPERQAEAPTEPTQGPPHDSGIPPLVQAAMARLRVCYFDRPAVFEHLKRLRADYEHTPTDRNRFRYLNDWFIMDAIDKIAQPASPDTPHLYRFAPRYVMQATGRIGTPLQSASRAMKAATYGSLEGVFNYDLSSSQMALCLREFERHGIACPWLDEYLHGPDKRDELARRVGVTAATWKECLYTVLMTGHIPTNTAWQGSPVVEALAEEIAEPSHLAAALARLRETLKPLARCLKQWHRIVASEAERAGSVTNLLGIARRDFDKTSGMVAHLLQGTEAYFIHTLTLLADAHGFEPIGNEHDGLITLGPIPPAAIREAQDVTGLHCLDLREKPFA